jgi:phosphatidylglycerophosphate synthase
VTGLRNVAAGLGVLIGASGLGKSKMVVQVIAIILFLLTPLYPLLRQPAFAALAVVVVLTIASGVDYFVRFYREVLRPAAAK